MYLLDFIWKILFIRIEYMMQDEESRFNDFKKAYKKDVDEEM